MKRRQQLPGQRAIVAEGITPDDADLSDVFALWVERVADYNAAAQLLTDPRR